MLRKSEIKNIKAREILDSRGNPTVEVELTTDSGKFLASVPSGASKGKYEAAELRDGGKRYQGMGVLKAVNNVNKIIAPKLRGKDASQQKEIDDFLIKLDGTKNKSKLGANAILGASMAVCRAAAGAQSIPLYSYIFQLYRGRASVKLTEARPLSIPRPCFNLINGGAHAKGGLDFQEFMAVPQEKIFSKNLKIGKELYNELKKIIQEKYGSGAIKIGDEGGFVPALKTPEEAIELILKAAENLGYENKVNPVRKKVSDKLGKIKSQKILSSKLSNGVKIILDVAASHFLKGKRYKTKIGNFTSEKLVNYYENLIRKYPIIGIEDPFGQEDWRGWQELKLKIKNEKLKFLLIGDDLLVTNPKRIEKAQKKKACNAAILKLNQIGTVSEAIEAARLAKSFNWKIVVSHRSGETEDDFIADLSVGIAAEFIKSGAPSPKERMAKYKRLVKIEEELKR